MVRVPKDLSGASLLGVHNWVKGNIARSNPGGSPDYTISDSEGNRLTLSDVARSAGSDINIEVTTVSGARSNPPANLTMIPSTDIPYPDMVRTGNNLSDLLPGEIDSALATRVVAEQGLHRGLHLLNRLTLSTYSKQISSPTTAALLQMGEIIKSNPSSGVRRNSSDRTPFTQRTPLQYGGEKALQQWLVETSGADEKEISVANTEVEDAKIHAKYGLNTQDIAKFAQDVLADYLFAASANRGLVRTLIRHSPSMKADKQAILRMVSMFPQQAADFYEGRQRVFVAHPAFIYPAYASSILSKKDIKTITNFARDYPRNITRKDGLPIKLKGLVNRGGSPLRRLRNFITLGPRATYDSSQDVDDSYADVGYMKTVIDALAADPRADLRRRGFKPISYHADLGGFYPSPPPKWPRKLMYAIMDGFLENLPHLINLDSPSGVQNLTPVQMLYFADPQEIKGPIRVDVVTAGDKKDTAKTSNELNSLLREIEAALAAADPAAIEKLLTGGAKAFIKDAVAVAPADRINQLQNIKNNIDAAIMERKQDAVANVTQRTELTFDAAGPKSLLEITYDISEIATSKYDYNLRGDDFKFVMAVVNYSLESLSKRTQGSAFQLTTSGINSRLESIMGQQKYQQLQTLEARLTASAMDEAPRAAYKQTIFLAKLMAIRDEMSSKINSPLSAMGRNEERERQKANYLALVQGLDFSNFSPSLNAGVQQVLTEMRDLTVAEA
jgi:hypothetical protein